MKKKKAVPLSAHFMDCMKMIWPHKLVQCPVHLFSSSSNICLFCSSMFKYRVVGTPLFGKCDSFVQHKFGNC